MERIRDCCHWHGSAGVGPGSTGYNQSNACRCEWSRQYTRSTGRSRTHWMPQKSNHHQSSQYYAVHRNRASRGRTTPPQQVQTTSDTAFSPRLREIPQTASQQFHIHHSMFYLPNGVECLLQTHVSCRRGPMPTRRHAGLNNPLYLSAGTN